MNEKPINPAKQIKQIISKSIVLSLFISMIVGGIFGFLVTLAVNKNLKESIKQDILSGDFSNNTQQEVKGQQPLSAGGDQVIQVVEKAKPAVVSIIISKDVPVIERYWESPFGSGGLEDFFGPFDFQVPRQRQNGTREREIGGGSGFIVSKDGFIITNKHVVADENAQYTVLTNNEKRYKAKILDKDPINDIAILKIDPQNPEKGEGQKEFAYLELGDSSNLQTGQTVIAIGNSLGEFRNTVSKGIISGLKRNIVAGNGLGQAESLSQLIQTDAALNQGNSGGPLLNLRGEVVGVNVAMAAGAENISFALPINIVKNIIESIKEEGEIVRPFMGIRFIINNSIIAENNDLPYNYGAILQRGESPEDLAVIPGSPADKAGLEENDIILEINGKKITENYLPSTAIADKKPGDSINLKVWSDGEIKDIELRLDKRNS